MRVQVVVSSLVAAATAQGVTEYLAPKGSAPADCATSMPAQYELSVLPLGKKKQKRVAFEASQTLKVTLKNGVLLDGLSRTGYIADNYQFQFDGPPQAGSLYTGGWSLCKNGSLALGPSTMFYQCLSGSFYNLYDRWWAAQCNPIHIQAHSLAVAAAPASPSAAASPSGSSANAGSSAEISIGGADTLALPSGAAGAAAASVSSEAKATGDHAGHAAASSITSAVSAASTDLINLSNATSALSLNASLSSAASSASSISSAISSASSSLRSATSAAKTNAPTPSSSTNGGIKIGQAGSTVALLMGVVGMVLA